MDRENMEKQLDAFLEEYGINLTEEQRKAVLCQEGNTLLLAVPGSGKTTVLLTRIGFMVKVLGIKEKEILAVTYTRKAAEEMKDRFEKKFGPTNVVFKTINSLSLEIYIRFCAVEKHPKRILINKDQTRQLMRSLIYNVEKKYVGIADTEKLQANIAYIKNMMLESKQDICDVFDDPDSFTYQEYKMYQEVLNHPFESHIAGAAPDIQLMDFDDQMRNAYWILANKPYMLDHYSKKYKYISVDEAQDNSKIQHEIIKILAEKGKSLFMVGDDDQSIYGFRAAYPEMLLNFKKEYSNANVLYLSTNFRSDGIIVSYANHFINQNKIREKKTMKAYHPCQTKVIEVTCKDRHMQYKGALKRAIDDGPNTAILYRDNESSALLSYYLLSRRIPFNLRTPEVNFFDFNQVKDMLAYFKFADDPYDLDAFKSLARKGIVYPSRKDEEQIGLLMSKRHLDVIEAFKEIDAKKASTFEDIMDEFKSMKSADAIDFLLEKGFESYIEQNNLAKYRIDTLKFLAEEIPDKKRFLSVTEALREKLKDNIDSDVEGALTLSTIHTAKGREWDNVHYIDLSDVCYSPDTETDNPFLQEESKRIFYVGITRAKKKLSLYRYKGDEDFTLLDILFNNKK